MMGCPIELESPEQHLLVTEYATFDPLRRRRQSHPLRQPYRRQMGTWQSDAGRPRIDEIGAACDVVEEAVVCGEAKFGASSLINRSRMVIASPT